MSPPGVDAPGAAQVPAYLDGRFLPLGEARVPVLDRGFIFGDGVYEVIPVYARHPLRLDDHLRRLQASLDGIGLANPHDPGQWRTLVTTLIGQAAFDDQSLYLQVTRGVARRDHAFPRDAAATVFMMTNPLVLPTAAAVEEGVAAITAQDNRWQRCDLKTTALLPNVLLRQQAVAAGAAEAVLLRDGVLTEGASSAVLVGVDGALVVPPEDHRLLPSITRRLLLELAAADGIAVRVQDVPGALLRAAPELMLASATREVLAITRLDGTPVGTGAPGPLFRRLHALYRDDRLRGAGAH